MVNAVELDPARPRVTRGGYALPFAVPFVVSMLSHGTIVAGLVFGAWLSGSSPADGEKGRGGAGDTAIDISIAGNPVPAAPPASSSARAPKSVEETPPAPVVTTPAPLPKTPPHQDDKPATESHETVQGTGAEQTHSGRKEGEADDPTGAPGGAPDSVAGQRALLPSAAVCKDPVAGRWEAMKYDPLWGIWVRFTLAIHRSPDDIVTGTITSRTWFGGPADRTPPSCEKNTRGDFTVRMPASGMVDSDQHITFGSSTYTVVSVNCPGEEKYAPDNFSGRIDGQRQEFQSVNNDGAHDVNAPYVFRRTSCSE